MEMVDLFPSVCMEFQCQQHHIPYLRSLWAVLDVAAGTMGSREITAADFASLPQALEMVRRSASELMCGKWPISQFVSMIWEADDRKAMHDFIKLNLPGLPPESYTQNESLTLMVSVQNAGLLSTLWSALESNDPDHKVNIEIATLPKAVAKIQTTLDQLLLPAINQTSCLDSFLGKGMVTEIVDHWTAFQKNFISLFIGWILPTVSYSNAHRLN